MNVRFALAFAAMAVLLGACAQPKASTRTTAAATSPPGDIPDTQQFVEYRAPAGYRVLFPEGWARSEAAGTVTFTWHFDGEQVRRQSGSPAMAAIIGTFHNVTGVHLNKQQLPGGVANVATFSSESAKDAVTGRSIALDNKTYVFHRGARTVVLNLWAPAGADNVDQWRRISRSFKWQ